MAIIRILFCALCAVSAFAATLQGVISFEKGPAVEGLQRPTAEQQQMVGSGFQEFTKTTFAFEIVLGDFEPFNGMIKTNFSFTSDAITEDDVGMARLGLSLVDGEAPYEEMNRVINQLAAGNPAGKIGNVVFIKIADENGSVERTDRLKMNGGFSMSVDQVALDMIRADAAQARLLFKDVVDAIAKLFKVKKQNVEAKLPQMNRRRRLLQNTELQVEYEVTGMTRNQAEAAVAMQADEDYATTLTGTLATGNSPILATAQVTSVAAPALVVPPGASSDLDTYEAPTYVPSLYVSTLHSTPRVTGGNTFTINPANLVNWLVGIGVATSFFVLMLIYNTICFPCCYCKCCKKNVKPLTTSPLSCNVITIVVVLILVLAGAGVVFRSGSFFSAFGATMKGVFLDLKGILSETDRIIGNVNSGLNSLDTTLALSAGCKVTDDIKGGLGSGGTISSPIDPSLTDTLNGVGWIFDLLDAALGAIASGLAALLLLAGLGVVFFTLLLIYAPCSDGKKKTVICLGHTITVLTNLLLLLTWIICIVMFIIAVALADFCYYGPIQTMFTSLDLNLGNILYLFTCEGEAPEFLFLLWDTQSKLTDAQANIAGLQTLISKSSGACGTADVTGIQTNLDSLINSVNEAGDLARCATFNPLLVAIFHSGVCDSLQGGASYVWVGGLIAGLTLIFGMFTFVKTVRQAGITSAKVSPEETEMAGLTDKGT